jgi:hypothetical protein
MKSSTDNFKILEISGLSSSWRHYINVFEEKDIILTILSLGTETGYDPRYFRIPDRFSSNFLREKKCPVKKGDDGACLVEEKFVPGVLNRMFFF